MDSLLADVMDDMPKTSRGASKPLGHQPAAPSVSTRSLGDSFDDDDGPNEESASAPPPPKRGSPVPSLDAGSDRGSERGASSNTTAAAASSIASVAIGGSGAGKAALRENDVTFDDDDDALAFLPGDDDDEPPSARSPAPPAAQQEPPPAPAPVPAPAPAATLEGTSAGGEDDADGALSNLGFMPSFLEAGAGRRRRQGVGTRNRRASTGALGMDVPGGAALDTGTTSARAADSAPGASAGDDSARDPLASLLGTQVRPRLLERAARARGGVARSLSHIHTPPPDPYPFAPATSQAQGGGPVREERRRQTVNAVAGVELGRVPGRLSQSAEIVAAWCRNGARRQLRDRERSRRTLVQVAEHSHAHGGYRG